jgi:hypothetical protein
VVTCKLWRMNDRSEYLQKVVSNHLFRLRAFLQLSSDLSSQGSLRKVALSTGHQQGREQMTKNTRRDKNETSLIHLLSFSCLSEATFCAIDAVMDALLAGNFTKNMIFSFFKSWLRAWNWLYGLFTVHFLELVSTFFQD